MILEFSLFSYRIFGRSVRGLSSHLKGLHSKLAKAGLLIPVEAYVSMMVFSTLIMFFVSSINIFTVIFVITNELLYSIILGFGSSIVVSLITFGILYMYPGVLAGKNKRAVEADLSFSLSFMGILSSSGVPPKRIFKTLAQLEQDQDVGLGGEAQVIYRDIEILGSDMLTSLKDAANRNISPLFSGVLEGIISTIKSGGDLTRFFDDGSKDLMRMKRSIMKEFIDTLVMISEMYMSVLVAFPLILIVMLVVLSSIGGGDIGGTSPNTIVPVVIYMLVPGAGLGLLLMLDGMSSK
ncbi:type II secretion system F family protein [Thermoproteota archaeon]